MNLIQSNFVCMQPCGSAVFLGAYSECPRHVLVLNNAKDPDNYFRGNIVRECKDFKICERSFPLGEKKNLKKNNLSYNCSVQPIFQIGLSLPPVQDLCSVNWNHKEWIFSEMAVMVILQRRTAQGTRHDTSTEPTESENSFQRFELHFSCIFLLQL